MTLRLLARFFLLLAVVTAWSTAAFGAAPKGKDGKGEFDARPTVAVLYFDYSGTDQQYLALKKGLASMVISDLSEIDRVRFVERDRIQEILDELKLNTSKSIDKKTANKVGKLLGCRYMVMGTVTHFGTMFSIDARVVEVETGLHVGTAKGRGKADDFMALEGQLVEGLTKVLVNKVPPLKNPPKAVKKPLKKKPRPKRLAAKTVLRYSRALDAKDKGDVETAKKELKAVVKEAPDLTVASADLDALLR